MDIWAAAASRLADAALMFKTQLQPGYTQDTDGLRGFDPRIYTHTKGVTRPRPPRLAIGCCGALAISRGPPRDPDPDGVLGEVGISRKADRQLVTRQPPL